MKYREYHVKIGESIIVGENQDRHFININILNIINGKIKFRISSVREDLKLSYCDALKYNIFWHFNDEIIENRMAVKFLEIERAVDEQLCFGHDGFLINMPVIRVNRDSALLQFFCNQEDVRLYCNELFVHSLSWKKNASIL